MIFDLTRRAGGQTERPFDDNADICFWDYDGTPVYSCSFDEIQNATALPNAPDHSNDEVPLTFFNWNWTLAELQASRTAVDVGAVYYPTDDKLHFYYKLNGTTGLTTSFTTKQSQTFTVDWGDGTVETWGSSTANGANPTHTYTAPGIYHVTIDGKCIPSSSLCTEAPAALVKGLFLGSKNNDSWLDTYWANGAANSSIETITGVWNIASSSANYPMLANNPYLKAFVFTTLAPGVSLRNAQSLRFVSLPPQLSGRDYLLTGAYSLKRLRMPDGVLHNRFLLQNAPIEFYRGAIHFQDLKNCLSLRRLVITDASVESNRDGINAPLEEIWCGLETPPTLPFSHFFPNLRPNAVIHVPASSLTTYQTATNWAEYASYMAGDWTAATEPDR